MQRKDWNYLEKIEKQPVRMLCALYALVALTLLLLSGLNFRTAQIESHKLKLSLSELMGDDLSGFTSETVYERQYVQAYSKVAWGAVYGASGVAVFVMGAAHLGASGRNRRILAALRNAQVQEEPKASASSASDKEIVFDGASLPGQA